MKLRLLKTIIKKKLGICIGMILVMCLGVTLFVGMNSFLKTLDSTLASYVEEYNYPNIVVNTNISDRNVAVLNDKAKHKSQDTLIHEYLTEYGYKSEYEALDDYKRKNNIEDNDEAIKSLIEEYSNGQVEYIKTPIEDVLSSITGVLDVDTRLYLSTNISKGETDYSSIVIVYRSDKFNNFYIWQETEPNINCRNVYIEKNFADHNNIKLKDIINIEVGDDAYQAYVKAVVSTPENIGGGVDDTTLNIDGGYLYISDTELGISDYSNYFNQLFIKTEDIFSQDVLKERIDQEIKTYGIDILNSYTYDDSNVKGRIYRNVDPINTLCKIIPTIFYLITLVVIYLCFSIIVKSSRRNISIYRALGSDIKKLTSQFCLLGVIITGICAILSIPLSCILIRVLCNYYENFFTLYSIPTRIDFWYFALANILSLVICEIAIVLNCKIISSYTPAEAMARGVDDDYNVPFLVKTVFSKTSPIFKFSLTTSLRNKSQLFFTIICISSSIAIIFASLSFVVGNNKIVDNLFDQRINYDCMIYFSETPNADLINNIAKLNYVDDVEEIKSFNKTIKASDLTYDVTINGIDSNSELIRIPNVNSLKDEGIVLDKYVATQLNVNVGDYVFVDDIKIPIIGISEQYTNRIEYVSYDQASKLKDNEYGCLVCKCQDKTKLLDYLSGVNTYISSSFTEDLYQSTQKMFDSFAFVSYILIAFSVSIGLTVILVNIKTNILDRTKQISVLRTLGYTTFEISFNNCIQLILQLLLSSIIGFPLGKGIAVFALKMIETSKRTYPYANGIKEVLITFIIVFMYMLVAQLVSTIDIKKWNISENIKDGE